MNDKTSTEPVEQGVLSYALFKFDNTADKRINRLDEQRSAFKQMETQSLHIRYQNTR